MTSYEDEDFDERQQAILDLMNSKHKHRLDFERLIKMAENAKLYVLLYDILKRILTSFHFLTAVSKFVKYYTSETGNGVKICVVI